MKKHIYTTTGNIEQAVQTLLSKYSQKPSFLNALALLLRTGRCTEYPSALSCTDGLKPLSDSRFFDLLSELPVSVSVIMDSHPTADINEHNLIPDGKDIFAFKHIANLEDPLHRHNYYEINYVYYGCCYQIFEKEERSLRQGDFCIIAPGSVHSVQIAHPDNIVLSITIRKSTFDLLFLPLLSSSNLLSLFFRQTLYSPEGANYLLFCTDASQHLNPLFQSIIIESNLYDPHANACVLNYVNLLFANILRSYSTSIQFYTWPSNDKDRLNIPRLLQFIQQNYRTVSLPLLSQTFHYSEAYLSRTIKKYSGKNLTGLVQNIRLQEAQKLLIQTSMPIARIASEVGYDSPDHFTRVFKKESNMPPRDYRSKHKAYIINPPLHNNY